MEATWKRPPVKSANHDWPLLRIALANEQLFSTPTPHSSPRKRCRILPSPEEQNKKLSDSLDIAKLMTTYDFPTDIINQAISKFSFHANRNFGMFSVVSNKLMDKVKTMENDKFRFFCAWHDLAMPEENESFVTQIRTKFKSSMWFVLFFYFARKFPLLTFQSEKQTKACSSLSYIYVTIKEAERSRLELHTVFKHLNENLTKKALTCDACVF
jgi:hypothetical protein